MKKLILACAAAMVFFASAVLAAVNVNTASAKQLESLSGVGPVKAQAIVKYRKANGKFKNKSDLTKVDGIGSATLKEISDDITLGGKKK